MKHNKIIKWAIVLGLFFIGVLITMWWNSSSLVESDTKTSAMLDANITSVTEQPITSQEVAAVSAAQEVPRIFDAAHEPGGDVFPLQFTIPAGWDVEYVPSIESLNVYTLSGTGTALDRSQLFIRYFDASQFLTLSTVTIHSTTDRIVGEEAYTAKQYEIEKKNGVADFVDQPAWRNQRHRVTDFRKEQGLTRYYVVAANPQVDAAIVEAVFASMRILQ